MITKKSLAEAQMFEIILFQNRLGLLGAGEGTLKPLARYALLEAPGQYYFLMRQAGKSLHPITDGIACWRVILEVPYQEYSHTR